MDGNTRLAVEVDGPQHFSCEAAGLLAWHSLGS